MWIRVELEGHIVVKTAKSVKMITCLVNFNIHLQRQISTMFEGMFDARFGSPRPTLMFIQMGGNDAKAALH